MINLLVAMMIRFLVGCFLFIHLMGQTLFISTPRIENPKTGQVLQGVVVITGSTDLKGFQSAEISFRYSSTGQARTDWFLIHNGYEPVVNDTLAVWDTTTIADGMYDLRVLVTTDDGRQIEEVVSGLRVRNYTPIETSTPGTVVQTATMQPDAPTSTSKPLVVTPTALADNPLVIREGDAHRIFLSGIAIGTGAILLLGLYSLIKKSIR